MIRVKNSLEFNIELIADLIAKEGYTSVAVVSTLKETKAFDAFCSALKDAVKIQDFKVVAAADFSNNFEAVTAVDGAEAVILAESYGIIRHKYFDETIDILRVKQKKILGVVTLK